MKLIQILLGSVSITIIPVMLGYHIFQKSGNTSMIEYATINDYINWGSLYLYELFAFVVLYWVFDKAMTYFLKKYLEKYDHSSLFNREKENTAPTNSELLQLLFFFIPLIVSYIVFYSSSYLPKEGFGINFLRCMIQIIFIVTIIPAYIIAFNKEYRLVKYPQILNISTGVLGYLIFVSLFIHHAPNVESPYSSEVVKMVYNGDTLTYNKSEELFIGENWIIIEREVESGVFEKLSCEKHLVTGYKEIRTLKKKQI